MTIQGLFHKPKGFSQNENVNMNSVYDFKITTLSTLIKHHSYFQASSSFYVICLLLNLQLKNQQMVSKWLLHLKLCQLYYLTCAYAIIIAYIRGAP